MAAYSFEEFRTEPHKIRHGVKSVVIAVDGAAKLKDAVARAEATARAVNRTRDLANTPPGHLPPAELVARALQDIKGLPIKSVVLDEKQLRAGGYGGIVGVGQGAQRPPRLLRLEYRVKGAKKHLAFVGKGITFDTGGISLKPPLGMSEMKADMAGAAAVINATIAIARLGLPVNITTYAAIAENMPGSMAQRPGDVVTTYSGKTVEVLNTDAEGRMVLCDALTRVQEDKPDFIIDVATLTGACAVALGPLMSAIMSNDPKLSQDLLTAAAEAGEHFWELPLPKMYRNMLDSKVADLANVKEMSPPAKGGTLVGGLFLQEFIKPDQSWAHLDIAPPAFNSGGAFGYTPTGGTGTATRTLIEYAHQHC
jgi:leucyl aminopeptidase